MGNGAFFSFISLRVIHPSIFLSPLFWAIIAIFIYIYYKHNQPGSTFNVFREHKTLSLGGGVLLTSLALMFVNFVLPPPPIIYEDDKAGTITVTQDDYSSIEADFFDYEKHFKLLKTHFQNPDSKGEEANYTINNFYAERRDSELKEISDIAYWGYGICLFYEENYHKAIHQLATVRNPKIPYLNYYIAKTLLTLDPDHMDQAFPYLYKEIKYHPHAPEEVYTLYIDVLYQKKDFISLKSILANPETAPYVDHEIAEEVYYMNNQLIPFFKLVIQKMYGHSDMVGFTAAMLIMLVWLIYMMWLDLYVPERILPTLLIAVLGMLLALCSIWIYDFYEYTLHFTLTEHIFNNFLYCILGIGLIEEIVKIIPLLVIILLRKGDLEPYDYIFYAAVSALGFAFAENIMYFGNLHASYTGRALTSCVGHMFFSSMFGYSLVLAKFREKAPHPWLYFIAGLFIAATFHGVYDFLIFNHFRLTFLIGFLMSVLIWIIIINNCLNNSQHFSYQISHRSEKLMVFVSISLVSIFVFEYVTFGINSGAEKANELLVGAAIIYGIFIFFFTSNITRLDLIRGYWRKIKLENEGEKIRVYSPIDIIYYAYRFFDLNTQSPQNFVSKEIIIYSHPRNEYLIHEIKEPLRGKIIDRIVIETRAKNNEPYLDPTWFLVSLHTPFNQNDYINNYVLMRFFDKNIESTKIKSYSGRLMAIPKSELLTQRKAKKENFIDLGGILVGFALDN